MGEPLWRAYSKQLIGGPKPFSSCNFIFESFFTKCSDIISKDQTIGKIFQAQLRLHTFFGLIVQTALPWTKYFMAFSSSY